MKTHRPLTLSPRQQDLKHQWHLIDAHDQVLGHLASELALILQGKNKPNYAPHLDGGDYVVLINASKIVLTRGKENKKIYKRHSNYPGGFAQETFADLLKRQPQAVIKNAVKGMLPANRLRDARLSRLKVFAGSEHSYQNYLSPKVAAPAPTKVNTKQK